MQEFELRMYDPRIGRWLSPDPYGQFHSPYLAMGNTPQMSVDPDGGFCCGAVETIIDGVAYMMLPEVVTTASRITATALPIITSVISYNMSGGPIFKGVDDGLYSMAPSMTGNRYYQAIDNQWQLIRDDGLMQEQYARDISTAADKVVGTYVTLTEIALSGYGGFLRGAGARQMVAPTLRPTLQEGAKVTANIAERSVHLTKNAVIRGYRLGNHAWRKSVLGRGATKEMIEDTIDGAIKANTVVTETGTGQFAGNIINRFQHNGVTVVVDETRKLIMSIRSAGLNF